MTNWWWVNQPDSECIAGEGLSTWLTSMETVTQENTFDEIKGDKLEDFVPLKKQDSTFEKVQATLHETKKIIKRSTRSLKKMMRK